MLDSTDIITPTPMELIKGFTKSIITWSEDGFKVVPEEILKKRKEICMSCARWNSKAYGGIGNCRICGCTKLKLYLPSERCKDNPPKWIEYV